MPRSLPTIDRETCCYITTGGVLPPGADAVVMVENVTVCKEGADSTSILVARDKLMKIRSGDDVRSEGSDVMQGEVVIRRGSVIGEAEVRLWLIG